MMGVRSDRARYLADGNVLGCQSQATPVPAQLVEPDRELQAERRWLGVHAVGTPDRQRPLVFERPVAHDLDQGFKSRLQEHVPASRDWIARPVSTTSEDVRPR